MNVRWLRGEKAPFEWIGIYVWRIQLTVFHWRYGFYDGTRKGHKYSLSFLWKTSSELSEYRQLMSVGIRKSNPFIIFGDDLK